MSDEPEVSVEQLRTIGRLVIDILQGAANQGLDEITIGDLMRTFGYSDEEAEPWDAAVLVFLKDDSDDRTPESYVIH